MAKAGTSGEHAPGQSAQFAMGFANRFTGIPDVHYGEDDHWVAGNRGVSTWLLSGTFQSGEAIKVGASTCSISGAA